MPSAWGLVTTKTLIMEVFVPPHRGTLYVFATHAVEATHVTGCIERWGHGVVDMDNSSKGTFSGLRSSCCRCNWRKQHKMLRSWGMSSLVARSLIFLARLHSMIDQLEFICMKLWVKANGRTGPTICGPWLTWESRPYCQGLLQNLLWVHQHYLCGPDCLTHCDQSHY